MNEAQKTGEWRTGRAQLANVPDSRNKRRTAAVRASRTSPRRRTKTSAIRSSGSR